MRVGRFTIVSRSIGFFFCFHACMAFAASEDGEIPCSAGFRAVSPITTTVTTPQSFRMSGVHFAIPLNMFIFLPDCTDGAKAFVLNLRYPELVGPDSNTLKQFMDDGWVTRKLKILITNHPVRAKSAEFSGWRNLYGTGRAQVFDSELSFAEHMDTLAMKFAGTVWDVFFGNSNGEEVLIRCTRGRAPLRCEEISSFKNLDVQFSFERARLPEWSVMRKNVIELLEMLSSKH